MRFSFRAWVLLACCGLPACSGCSDKKDQASKEPARAFPTALPSAAGRFAPLRQRLVEEAEHRVAVPLKTEDIFAALEKDGVALERKRQQTASPHFASYCMSAHAGVKVHVTVCEHESDERAEENVKSIQRVERPERKIVKNGQTSLLVRRDLNNDAEAPLVDKILHVFEQLEGAEK